MAKAEAISAELMTLLGTGRQVAPFSSRDADFGLADAYAVAALVRDARLARGETPVGRKIGFTNRGIWTGFGISGPIWNYMFDTTVRDASEDQAFDLAGMPEPRIEPEIVLHLARAPHAAMSEEELAACIDWVAHAFEVVYSPFPGWKFAAADAAAAYGVHGGLVLGDSHPIFVDRTRWLGELPAFSVEMKSDKGAAVGGQGSNVLGGPVKALWFLVQELARYSSEPLRAGEIVTTGTLTEALPVASGETWTTTLSGIDLPGLKLTFR